MRIMPVVLAFALCVALLAACGGGSNEEDNGAASATATAAGSDSAAAATVRASATPGTTATAKTTATPKAQASSTAVAEAIGCQFPSDIKSFRFTMTLKANLPSTPETGTGGEGGLGDLLGGLSGLMGDMKVEGAVITPDRSSAVMTVGGHEFGSFIQIGSESWTKVAGLTDWTQQSASEGSAFFLSPEDVCQSTEEDLSTALSQIEGKNETVNGIEAVHYHLDKADLSLLQEVLGGTEDLSQLPEELTVDVWLAQDGNWPVRMAFSGSGQDAQGQPTSFDVSVEFKDFNDSSIKIEPPI